MSKIRTITSVLLCRHRLIIITTAVIKLSRSQVVDLYPPWFSDSLFNGSLLLVPVGLNEFAFSWRGKSVSSQIMVSADSVTTFKYEQCSVRT
jgi:hypothetical protein